MRVGFRPHAMPGMDVLGQGRAVSSEPRSSSVTMHLMAAPPGPEAWTGGKKNGRWTADERPTWLPGPLSDFSFSPLWGTICGFRWSGLVSQLPPELHQWTDLPVFCHRAQGLWYGFLCVFICFLIPSKSSGPSQLCPSSTPSAIRSHCGHGQNSLTDRTTE